MTNGAVNSSHSMTRYCLSWKHTWEGLYLFGYIKRGDFFLFLHSSSGLPVVCSMFWCNACSIIDLACFFCTMFVERISVLGEDFAFNYISPNNLEVINRETYAIWSNKCNCLIVFHRLENI